MKKSEQINEIASALSKAQGTIRGAVKDSLNPFFKSNYADLASVWDACRDPLSNNGLSVVQCPDTTDQGMVLITTLMHTSGQWIESTYPIKPVKDDPQGLGSSISYARRYSLAAMVGIFQVDDDAESAQGRNQAQEFQPDIKNVQQRPSSPTQLKKISNDAETGPHEHRWLPSHFQQNEEWCSVCKLKRKVVQK